jgi:hypothetical protein
MGKKTITIIVSSLQLIFCMPLLAQESRDDEHILRIYAGVEGWGSGMEIIGGTVTLIGYGLHRAMGPNGANSDMLLARMRSTPQTLTLVGVSATLLGALVSYIGACLTLSKL